MSNTLLKNRQITQDLLNNLQIENGTIPPYIFYGFTQTYSENSSGFTFPEGLKYIPQYAFYNCLPTRGSANKTWVLNSDLKAIGNTSFQYISGSNAGVSLVLNDGLKFIGNDAFTEIGIYSGINKTFTIPNSVIHVGSQLFNVNGRQNYITTVNWSSNCHIIPQNCFQYCGNISSINNLDNVYFIYDRAFQNCSALTNISLPNIKAVTESAFQYSNLTTLTVGSNLTSIGMTKNTNAIYNSNITTINVIGDENCITAQTLAKFTSAQLKNATIVYNYTPPTD